MAVELKSGDGSDKATVDAVSKAIRTTAYSSDGTEINNAIPIPLPVNPVTVVDNDIIAAFDASPYKFVSLQLTGEWVGTVEFQASADQGTWFTVASQNVGELSSPYITSISTTGGVKIPVMFKHLRVRVVAYTSGTVDGTAFGHKEDSNTGQISAIGEVSIVAGQTLDNLNKLGGEPISMGSGSLDAGTQRVSLADGQQIDSIDKMGGEIISMGAGSVDTGTQRVSLAADEPVNVVLGASSLNIGVVEVAPTAGPTLLTDYYSGLAGVVDVNSRVIRAQPSTLMTIVMNSVTSTPRYLKIYDQATVPVAGEGVPVIVVVLFSGGTFAFPLPVNGLDFANGIAMTFTQKPDNDDTSETATRDFSVTSIFT